MAVVAVSRTKTKERAAEVAREEVVEVVVAGTETIISATSSTKTETTHQRTL